LAPTIAERPALRPQADKTLWTCPMHQQIVCDAPGFVPDLRHGAGAMTPTMAAKTRIARYDAAVLDQSSAVRAVLQWR